MISENLKRKAIILYKRVSRDVTGSKQISVYKCNDYIKDIESLKDELYDSGSDWVEDFAEIENLEEPDGFFSGADEEAIEEVLQEVEEQLDRILGNLGIALSEMAATSTSFPSSPVTVIHNNPIINQHANISPTISQYASSSSSSQADIHIEIKRLEEEFHKESDKLIPNKSKLQNIIDKLKKLGPIAMPIVKKLSEKLADMFLF